MKHTLLATTALVAVTGAAAAEITISGTARLGMVTTEGAAAVTAVTTNAGAVAADDTLLDAIAAVTTNLDASTGAVIAAGTLNTTAVTADELNRLDAIRAIVARQAESGLTAAIKSAAVIDLAQNMFIFLTVKHKRMNKIEMCPRFFLVIQDGVTCPLMKVTNIPSHMWNFHL